MYFQGYNLNFMNNVFSSKIDWFHSFGCSFLAMVLVFVFMLYLSLMSNTVVYKSYLCAYQLAEFLCSMLPSFVLLILMVPSLGLLYEYGSTSYCGGLAVGVVGHQWYWSYEYSDYDEKMSFDSYMLPSDDLGLGSMRLLDVDNRCVVPAMMDVGFLIGSEDVIHSWCLPSLSIKVDALGGVLSQVVCKFPLIGVYYGQCSEICGAFHSFMPIVVESCLPENFISWAKGWL